MSLQIAVRASAARRFALFAVPMLCLCVVDVAQAATKHPARTSARAQPAAAASVERAPAGGAARMIEIEPGIFVSTFDCIADDGRGHRRQCNGTGGGGAGAAGGSGM